MKCEDCIEWEYFEGYGYGCFCMKTMTPIDAEKCEFYADKRPDVPHSWKPSTDKAESKLDNDPIDIDKAVEHYEETLEALKDIDLGVDG